MFTMSGSVPGEESPVISHNFIKRGNVIPSQNHKLNLNRNNQTAERLRNQAINQKVAGSIPGRANGHFTPLASGECPCTYCKSL